MNVTVKSLVKKTYTPLWRGEGVGQNANAVPGKKEITRKLSNANCLQLFKFNILFRFSNLRCSRACCPCSCNPVTLHIAFLSRNSTACAHFLPTQISSFPFFRISLRARSRRGRSASPRRQSQHPAPSRVCSPPLTYALCRRGLLVQQRARASRGFFVRFDCCAEEREGFEGGMEVACHMCCKMPLPHRH